MLLQSSESEQNAEGRRILENVISDVPGSAIAREAKTILDQDHRHRERPQRRDPVLKQFLERWHGVQGLFDGQLIGFLRDLKQQDPTKISYMRKEVVEDLRQWIQGALPRVSKTMSADQRRLLDTFVETISEIEDYAQELKELKPLRRALFEIRYEEIKTLIEEVLRTWDTEAAWDYQKALKPPLASFEDRVSELEDRICQTEKDAAALDDLLDEFPAGQPSKWLDMQLLAESLRQLRVFEQHKTIPEAKRKALNDAVSSSETAGMAFLEQQARAALRLKDIRNFWKEYQGLHSEDSNVFFDAEPAWFEDALGAYLETQGSRGRSANRLEDLEAFTTELLADKRGLPPFAEEQIEQYAHAVHQIVSDWEAMRAGKPFTDAVTRRGGVRLPRAFQDQAPVFLERLDRVAQAFDVIGPDGGPPQDESAYAEAVDVAREILKEHPGHDEAGRLKAEAERRIEHLHLDAALFKWDIETFLKKAVSSPVPAYAELSQQEDLLGRFATLAQQRPFATWKVARAWWAEWEALSGDLPISVPGAFYTVLKTQQDVRFGETYTVLEQALANPLSPEQCEEILATLDKGFSLLIDLNAFKVRFTTKRQMGLVERYIQKQQWDAARKVLYALDEDQEETRRLKTTLDVEEAATQGVRALAGVLRRSWNNVEHYYPRAGDLLLRALEQTWDEDAYEALKDLEHPLSRAAHRNATNPIAAKLRQWQAWMVVEEALRDEVSVHDVKRIIGYTRSYQKNPTRKKHLEKLVQRWKRQGNVLMMAWAYEAFDQDDAALLASADNRAVADMTMTSERVTENIHETLHTRDDLELTDLQTLKTTLGAEAERWDKLNLYLELLPHVSGRYEVPDALNNVGETLDNLIDVWRKLDAMYQSDLRTIHNEVTWIERRIANEFAGIAIQGRLWPRAQRLMRLAELTYYETKVFSQAKNCGKLDRSSLYERREQFLQLNQQISDVINIFDQTGLRDGFMWKKVSEEYAEKIRDYARILIPLNGTDLGMMTRQIRDLEKEEKAFHQAIEYLEKNMPVVQTATLFDPERHQDYLSHFPAKKPRSMRVFEIFRRFAIQDEMAAIITQSHTRELIPDWVQTSLNEEPV